MDRSPLIQTNPPSLLSKATADFRKDPGGTQHSCHMPPFGRQTLVTIVYGHQNLPVGLAFHTNAEAKCPTDPVIIGSGKSRRRLQRERRI